LKVEISVAEVVQVFKEIQEQPEKILEMVRADMPQVVGCYLSEIMRLELTRFLGRPPYERAEDESNHRNGSYPRCFTLKGIGEVPVQVPRDRKGEYQTQVIPKSKQYEDELRQDIAVMFLSGVSTRTLAMISNRLLGHKISAGEVSRCSQELVGAIENWRNRDLASMKFKYLFCDGVYLEMRVDRTIEKVSVLVVIGVTEKGQKQVIGIQSGDHTCPKQVFGCMRIVSLREYDGQITASPTLLFILNPMYRLNSANHHQGQASVASWTASVTLLP